MSMNKYLIHLKYNLIFLFWNIFYINGVYGLVNVFVYKTIISLNPYIFSSSILVTLALIFFQTRYSFNKESNFELSKYNLKSDENEIHRDFCNTFKYSNVAGDLILTNKRIIFTPKADFNNFYFDINLNDIKEFKQDNAKQPILVLNDGTGYTLKIRNRAKFVNKYNSLDKKYWSE